MHRTIDSIISGQDLYCVVPETTVVEVARYMADRRIGAVSVIEDDRLVGIISERGFADKVADLIGSRSWLWKLIRPLLRARNLMREQAGHLEIELTEVARADPVCRRLMTAPGVGPIVALTYKLAVGDPTRFARSRSVAAHLGLTPRLNQSGDIARRGRISCWGDAGARRMLFMAGRAVLNPRTGVSGLKSWGVQVAARRGKLKATVAVARRLAVILHRMWIDGTNFREEVVKA